MKKLIYCLIFLTSLGITVYVGEKKNKEIWKEYNKRYNRNIK